MNGSTIEGESHRSRNLQIASLALSVTGIVAAFTAWASLDGRNEAFARNLSAIDPNAPRVEEVDTAKKIIIDHGYALSAVVPLVPKDNYKAVDWEGLTKIVQDPALLKARKTMDVYEAGRVSRENLGVQFDTEHQDILFGHKWFSASRWNVQKVGGLVIGLLAAVVGGLTSATSGSTKKVSVNGSS